MTKHPLPIGRPAAAPQQRQLGTTDRLTQVAVLLAVLVIEMGFVRYAAPPAATDDPAPSAVYIGP